MHSTVRAQTGPEAGPPPDFVRNVAEPLKRAAQFDVVVCGGTLGIFLARALQVQGFRCVHLCKPQPAKV